MSEARPPSLVTSVEVQTLRLDMLDALSAVGDALKCMVPESGKEPDLLASLQRLKKNIDKQLLEAMGVYEREHNKNG